MNVPQFSNLLVQNLFPRFLSPFAWFQVSQCFCFQFLCGFAFWSPFGFALSVCNVTAVSGCRIFSIGCRGPIWQRVFNGSLRLYFEVVFLLLTVFVFALQCHLWVCLCVSCESHHMLILRCRFWKTCLLNVSFCVNIQMQIAKNPNC